MKQLIQHNGADVAFIVDHSDMEDGTTPLTDPAWSLQMLAMQRPKGYIFAKHTHTIERRDTDRLQEAVVVIRGKLHIVVCTRGGEDVGEYDLSEGQCLYLIDGGYRIEVEEDARFFEFKNGPHHDDKIPL